MKNEIACIGCDLLLEIPDTVPSKAKLSCPRCNHTLTRGHINALDYTLSVVITCMFLLVVSYSFEFISFETNGQSRGINLIQATQELYIKGFYFLALLVLLLTVIFPVIYLLLLIRVLVPLKLNSIFNRKKESIEKPMYIVRIISRLMPWLMVDVFLIGVLVALIKMWSLATLTFGVSFWAYVVFVVLFSYLLYCVDQHKLLKWVKHGG